MARASLDLIRGTLDLLILKTLTWGPLHGYSIASTIKQSTEGALLVEEGALYPALYRLEEKGWIGTHWGISETKRKVKFYSLTKAGTKQLRIEITNWENATALVARFLEDSP